MVDLAIRVSVVFGFRKALVKKPARFLMQASQSLGRYRFMALLASASHAMLDRGTIGERSSRLIWRLAMLTVCCNPRSSVDRPMNSGWRRGW